MHVGGTLSRKKCHLVEYCQGRIASYWNSIREKVPFGGILFETKCQMVEHIHGRNANWWNITKETVLVCNIVKEEVPVG